MKRKYILSILVLAIVIIVLVVMFNKTQDEEYLRLHIRANSNSEEDQVVKYEIKDLVVDYLTNYMQKVESKEDAINVINENKNSLVNRINNLLKMRGFDYKSNIVIKNEKFPTRIYNNELTLEEGYYDAIIVELGKAKGDNWWCVAYPPLCFVTNDENVEYRSFIYDYIVSLLNRAS